MTALNLKSRITITRPAPPTQNTGGGLVVAAPSDTWTKWAQVESRSGAMSVDSAQREWNYDYKVTVRYTPSNVERSTDLVTYNGKTLLIRSVSFDDEVQKRFVILRCSNNE